MIDDDVSYSGFVRRALEKGGYQVELAASGRDGLAKLDEARFDLVITDLRLRDVDGLAVIQHLCELEPVIPVILMTGFGTSDVAIKAMQLGAVDFLSKPFENSDLISTVQSALATRPVAEESVALEPHHGEEYEIIGKSRVMQAVLKQISRLAPSKLTVLIHGETGAGKELVARALHQYGDRAQHSFVAVNCMAIPETLLESELFGHERGAFTGAAAQKIGWFERADHGTLFLDEIGDISLATQGKLLRVLQEKSVHRLGGRVAIPVNVRVIAATNRNLPEAVRQQAFREDLYYRLSGAVIKLPPLRERKEDILSLVSHFIRRYKAETGAEEITISLAALQLLEQQSWPGNVRELENVIYRALLLARSSSVNCDTIREVLEQPAAPAPAGGGPSSLEGWITQLLDAAENQNKENVYAELLETVERELYRQAHERAKGKQSKIIQWLGVSRPTVHLKLEQFKLLS